MKHTSIYPTHSYNLRALFICIYLALRYITQDSCRCALHVDFKF